MGVGDGLGEASWGSAHEGNAAGSDHSQAASGGPFRTAKEYVAARARAAEQTRQGAPPQSHTHTNYTMPPAPFARPVSGDARPWTGRPVALPTALVPSGKK